MNLKRYNKGLKHGDFVMFNICDTAFVYKYVNDTIVLTRKYAGNSLYEELFVKGEYKENKLRFRDNK
jgi:hypothetical protein